jgi:hypothetical protein
MPRLKSAPRVKLITQTPSGRNRTSWLPHDVAWAAARGIIRDTHCGVVLVSEYGKAVFANDGSGHVEWNERSTLPGQTTHFDERTIVCM